MGKYCCSKVLRNATNFGHNKTRYAKNAASTTRIAFIKVEKHTPNTIDPSALYTLINNIRYNSIKKHNFPHIKSVSSKEKMVPVDNREEVREVYTEHTKENQSHRRKRVKNRT